MKNWRTTVGAVCIILAMALTALAGVVAYVGPGVTSAPGPADTRAGEPKIVLAGEGSSYTLDEAEQMAADAAKPDLGPAVPGPDSTLGRFAAGSDLLEIRDPEGRLVGKQVDVRAQREALAIQASRTAQTKSGSVTITRGSDTGTTSHWTGDEINPGGPYGGPDYFEGTSTVTFSWTTNDPSIIFFRVDFDADGTFDFPNQAGAGPDGRWTTLTQVTRSFFDNYDGNVVIEGWDGFSRNIIISYEDNFDESQQLNWYWTPANEGLHFTANVDMTVTSLGYWTWFYVISDNVMRIWDFATQTELGACTTGGGNTYSWIWCDLPSAITLTAGTDYMLAGHKRTDDYPYFTGINTPSDPPMISLHNWWVSWAFDVGFDAFPGIDYGVNYAIPKFDFKWQVVSTTPDTTQAAAHLEIHNVPPSVFGITTVPDPGLEGSTPVELTGYFNDPGTDDTWQARWTYSDGTDSGWFPISKYRFEPRSSARVLLLHTYTYGDTPLRDEIAATCGAYCEVVDMFDFGPLGKARPPTLAEIASYNVIVVGTNYFHYQQEAMGDLLADYMDLGGGVVMMQAAFDNTYGGVNAITGRWISGGYSPYPPSSVYGGIVNIGTVYDPDHDIMQGVSTVTCYYLCGNSKDVTSGAQRIADWTDGSVAFATKATTSRAVALSIFPQFDFYTQGDWPQLIVNSIRWVNQQRINLPMPLQVDPISRIFPDDDPTTATPFDLVPVTLEVKDDDHVPELPPGQTFIQDDMEAGDGQWVASDLWHLTSYRSSSPSMSFAFNDESTHWFEGFHSGALRMAFSVDPAGAAPLHLTFSAWQETENGATEDNFFDAREVQVSTNGGGSWTTLAWGGRNSLSRSFQQWYTYDFDISAYASTSQLMVRFSFNTVDDFLNDYEGWYIDDVRVHTEDPPPPVPGLGSADGALTIANVPPTAVGGFSDALRDEAEELLFKGFTISDPALNADTEWFAYAYDFDDGTPAEWVYKGSMAPPQYKVLILHSLCYPTTPCPQVNWLQEDLVSYDDTGVVDQFDFAIGAGLFNPQPPTIEFLRQYDVIVVATRLAYEGFQPWDDTRTAVGDLLADYLDEGRGGVVTFRYAMEIDPDWYGDIWALRGRYIDEGYAPVERSNSLSFGGDLYGATKLGEIFAPDHDIFDAVATGQVDAPFTHGPDYPVTIGGANNAEGVDGVVLADWQDGNTAIGTKTLLNGMWTMHVGGYPWYCGQLTTCTGTDTDRFMRNVVGFLAGGLPTPRIPQQTHVWADNGIYNVDLMLIDDDMGYAWDFAANRPMEALPGQTSISHNTIPVAVNNVDPTIVSGSIEAFIAAQMCVRISGTGGNSVIANFYTDGILTSSTTVMRQSGSPNPTDERCGLVKVDVTAAHDFSATLTYSAPMGGSNPTWLVILPWRDPVTPGHGTITYKYDFEGVSGSVNQDLPTLKTDLLAGGEGAKIDFAAEAYDPGSDDLAFFWSWGTEAGFVYGLTPESVYAINVHHNDGSGRTSGVLEEPQFLGFSEPYFDRDANDERSPWGTTDFWVRDTAVHAFPAGQGLYYVFLLVLDDDNGRGYPSPFGLDGIDIEVIVVDLR